MGQTARWALLALVVLAVAFAVARRPGEPTPKPVQEASPYRVALDMSAAVKDLGSDDDGKAAAAVDSLVAQGPAAVPVVAAVLGREGPTARENAIAVLSELKLPESVPILVTALGRDDDADVRYDSAVLLGELADPRARDAVEAALQDQTWDVRVGAARACATLCASQPAVDRLVWMALYDEPPQTGIWARSSLVKMMKNPPSAGGADIARRVRAAIERDARPAAVGDGTLELRVRAALLLSDVGDASGVAALRQAASEQSLDPILMPYPLYALGEIGDAEAVPALHGALANERPEVRTFAYDALRKLDERKQPGAAEALASFRGQKPEAVLASPLP